MTEPTVEQLELSSIIFDETIYTRKRHNPAKVQEYANNMEAIEAAGAFLQVSANLKLIDGRHRHLAYLTNANGTSPTISVIVHHDIIEEKDEYRKAVELNSEHGMQLDPEDKRQSCANLYLRYGYTLETITEIVSVSKSFASAATKGIRDEEKRQRDEHIFDMWLRCDTQEVIAEAVGVSKQTVSVVIESLSSKVPAYFSGHSFSTDAAFTPPLYNIWSYGKKSNDVSHFGNSEQRIVDNLLWMYTNRFDIVVDPFAGGGSTIDVCRNRLRRYWCSDRLPIASRPDEIKKHDIVTDGPPPLNRNWSEVTLTYLDPPYWRQAAGQYSDDPTDLANMALDDFHRELVSLVYSIADRQSKGAIALLIQPTQWKADDRRFIADHVVHLAAAVKHDRWKLARRISCPYATEQYNAQQVEWAKANRQPLALTRELLVWEAS
jgi:hypothetical protein